jgi:AraC-like DNA-binding protein
MTPAISAPPPKTTKTLLSWTNAIAHALEAQGIESQALFKEVGIPYLSAANPSDRIETYKISDLCASAVTATQDPCFGLKLVPYLHAANFQALGYSLFSSSTLQEFCQRLVRFFCLVSESSQHYLSEEDDNFVLTLKITNPEVCDETVDAWMGVIVHFCRCIYRPNFAPLKVELTRPEPATNSQDFTRFYKAPITFSAERNALYFSREDFFAPLPTASKELARRNDEIIIEHLARRDRADIVRQVEAHIIELLPTGDCSREKIASKLNMSSRSLLNKLELQDTSYKEILEELRSTLAQQYMSEQSMPISEITFLLGFSDTSSFSRAFKRWTGKSPSEFRDSV